MFFKAALKKWKISVAFTATRLVFFNDSKKPKPSVQHPKGKLIIAKHVENIYSYGWMDSSGVYFIDPMCEPCSMETIYKKDSTGIRVPFQVPKLVVMYNKYMHAVNVVDQIRKFFGADTIRPTLKYTVRMFEIVFSFLCGQAYNLMRHLYKNDPVRLRTHTMFKQNIIQGLINHPVVRAPQNNGVADVHMIV